MENDGWGMTMVNGRVVNEWKSGIIPSFMREPCMHGSGSRGPFVVLRSRFGRLGPEPGLDLHTQLLARSLARLDSPLVTTTTTPLHFSCVGSGSGLDWTGRD
jgi:hypothetical protein